MIEFLVNTDRILLLAAGAVQAGLVLFWVISPIAGAIFAKGVSRWPLATLLIGVGLLTVNVTFVALSHYLSAEHRETFTDPQIVVISLAAGMLLGTMLCAWLAWVLGDPPSEIDREWKSLDKAPGHNLLPFEERRRERLLRKRKARGG
jgi:hypothetical protein